METAGQHVISNLATTIPINNFFWSVKVAQISKVTSMSEEIIHSSNKTNLSHWSNFIWIKVKFPSKRLFPHLIDKEAEKTTNRFCHWEVGHSSMPIIRWLARYWSSSRIDKRHSHGSCIWRNLASLRHGRRTSWHGSSRILRIAGWGEVLSRKRTRSRHKAWSCIHCLIPRGTCPPGIGDCAEVAALIAGFCQTGGPAGCPEVGWAASKLGSGTV